MIQEIRKQLEEHIKTSGKTQAKISKQTDLSSSVISQFLKGIYNGNNEEVALTIKKYLDLENSKNNETDEVIYNEKLGNTTRVLFATRYAHVFNEISMIHGDAGTGKTTALKHYAETNANVTLITANALCRTPKAIFNLIMLSIGKEPIKNESELMNRLIDSLKDTNKLLIIDEADHLSLRALQAIRNLNDIANIGIVLSGNDTIYRQMYGTSSVQYDQLRTRCSNTSVVNDYTVEEIQAIFPNLDSDCTACLVQIACESSLRTAIKCYKLALMLCKDREKKLTAKFLLQTRYDMYR